MAPITKQIGSSDSGTKSEALDAPSALNDKQTFLQPTGKCSVTGFLITFNNFKLESEALIENLCKSWTIKPANRLNVLGILSKKKKIFITWIANF